MELVVGAILDGKVTGITKFGAFVALPGGKSGLVHISNISDSYVNNINDFLSVGQEVKVKVMNIDQSNRVNLSSKTPCPRRKPRPSGSRPPPPVSAAVTAAAASWRRPRSAPSSPARLLRPMPLRPREPQTFEDKLKQYMAESESKLSQLSRYNDRGKGRRRRGS